MNSMPGAGGSGGAGGYGGPAGGGMPGGIPGGPQQTGAPLDQQQQQMMMQRQQQQQMMYMQQQQQQAARGMYPKTGMPQQHPGMLQQQNIYAMQQQQQMDPAAMQRYQAQMARQQQQHLSQQHMLESYRNLSSEERTARIQAHQMAQANASRGYPPGMQPAGGNPAMAAGHMGGQPQQPGSSAMGIPAAMGAVSGVIPSHYIKQEPLGGVSGSSGTGGMMGGHGGHGSPAQLMNVKQEPSLNIKQEPGASSSLQLPGGMQQQGAADDSPQMAMQNMQPMNMRMQQNRQAAMRSMAAQQQHQAAAMQGSPGSMVDPSMTVQQVLAAKADEARMRQQQAAAAGHPHMQQMQQPPMDPMQQHMHHQRMMYQQQQMQQQGMGQMHPQQQQLLQQRQQQMYAPPVPSAGSMGPPPSMQQQPMAAVPVAGPPLMAAAPLLGSSDDEDKVKFKMQVEALKEKYGSVVERIYKRAAADLNMPRFITVCRELFSGARAYNPENSKHVCTLEKKIDGYLERQSITAGIMLALESMVSEEAKALENGEGVEKSPSTASASYASSRILPDPWPLDVRARRVRVPDGLSRHVRSHAMDARLISRRKRHADAMREEEDLPLWSARRMRHECDLDGELEEMERLEPSADTIISSPFKIAPEHSLPTPLVNTVLKSEIMEQTLRRKQMSGESQDSLPRLYSKMPKEAMKELSMHRWRLVTDDRLMFTETTNFTVVIAMGEMAVPPLHVVIPSEYPTRPATVLFEKTFPKSHPQLRRLGEAMEARLANVSFATQGRLSTMAEVYKATCEDFFGVSRSIVPSTMPVMLQQQEQSPSPSSFSSSTSTSPADSTVSPPTIPMLHHLPTTYRPPNKFRAIDGNAKSRMVY